MNEIHHIHLGRQPFVIAVDAHKQLREYLDAVAKAVGKSHKEVIEEVELRMAELLTERGITGEKAILPEDVAYLKQQLGNPRDFTENASEDEPSDNAPKRLYRDEQNGMIAGVCAGLGAYFKLDAVIVRLIFIVMTLLWGWGALLYIILWFVMPPARTGSERLQMRGKAVTVESLKELVDRADLPGAASRANKTVGTFIESFAKGVLWVLGVIFMVVATSGLFALGLAGVYAAFNRGEIVNPTYPVAGTDLLFAACLSIVAALLLVFMAFIGVAMTRRKWPLPGWITAALIGIFFAASSVGLAMAPKVVDKIQDHCQNNGCAFSEADVETR